MGEDRETGTWHYGLIARWWAEFNTPEPRELAYYGAAIRRFGEPALDLGCGNGRLLIPLAASGLDIDGVDVSADMIALARSAAEARGLRPGLWAQAGHQLDLPRRYRTIYVCGVLGLGGRRDRDREMLRRAFAHLEPGGALVLWTEYPYAGQDRDRWAIWLPEGRAEIPRPWREAGDRRTMADGDDLELISRVAAFDPVAQRVDLEMRARRWHDGTVVDEELRVLSENVYFAPELALLFEDAGFTDIEIEAAYENRPATVEDAEVIYVARRPAAEAAPHA